MNLPSLLDFVRDPADAFRRQHAEYAAKARECLRDARATYGIGRRCCLRSARHFGKMARLTLEAARQREVAA